MKRTIIAGLIALVILSALVAGQAVSAAEKTPTICAHTQPVAGMANDDVWFVVVNNGSQGLAPATATVTAIVEYRGRILVDDTNYEWVTLQAPATMTFRPKNGTHSYILDVNYRGEHTDMRILRIGTRVCW